MIYAQSYMHGLVVTFVCREEFAAAWMNLGIVQASLMKNESAERSYRTAISHRRKYPDCYYNLGNLVCAVHMHTNVHTCTHSRMQMHTHMHACIHMPPHMHAHTCTNEHTCTNKHTHTYAHTLTNTCIHTHTHAHTYTRTHTHIHITYSLVLSCICQHHARTHTLPPPTPTHITYILVFSCICQHHACTHTLPHPTPTHITYILVFSCVYQYHAPTRTHTHTYTPTPTHITYSLVFSYIYQYLDTGRHDLAIQAWRNATSLKPTHVNAWSNIVILLDQLRKYCCCFCSRLDDLSKRCLLKTYWVFHYFYSFNICF
jgi:tetratricopeptide (TPR) repeat protein